MRLLWLTWKDHGHPAAGGAEVVTRELTRRFAREGHQVTILTCGYKGATRRETCEGVEIIRVGSNRYLHPFQALAYYLMHLRNKFDVVIEEVNAAPYFSVFFGKRSRRFLFYHHLSGEVWLFEAKPPLSYLGYHVLEPLATHLLGRAKVPLITVSESTKQDMVRYGFSPDNTHIISEGIEIEPMKEIQGAQKFDRPTMLSLGSMRATKRTLDQVKAFEIAKQHIPNLQLKIAGDASGEYGEGVLNYIKNSEYRDDIDYLGRVSRDAKQQLMAQSHLITVTSVKEGWGLIVTEAASQGTPAVAYNVHGLRDSIRHNQSGILTDPDPAALAEGVVSLLQDKERYGQLRQTGWQWSKQITFDQSYRDIKTAIGI